MYKQLNNEWWLKTICRKWKKPEVETNSICSFDLFFLTQLAKFWCIEDKKITEFGCGATTEELCRLGFDVECFSLDVSEPVKRMKIEPKFNKCNIMDPGWLDVIQDSVKNCELLVIDALHSWEFARYYSENFLPLTKGLVWIHDYFSHESQRTPLSEQDYLDKFVVGKTHDVLAMTDTSLEVLKRVSKYIGFDITKEKYQRHKCVFPNLCSIVLIPKEV